MILIAQNYKQFFLSALLRNFFLCQDPLSGVVPPHLAQPCCVALGWALIWGKYTFNCYDTVAYIIITYEPRMYEKCLKQFYCNGQYEVVALGGMVRLSSHVKKSRAETKSWVERQMKIIMKFKENA